MRVFLVRLAAVETQRLVDEQQRVEDAEEAEKRGEPATGTPAATPTVQESGGSATGNAATHETLSQTVHESPPDHEMGEGADWLEGDLGDIIHEYAVKLAAEGKSPDPASAQQFSQQ